MSASDGIWPNWRSSEAVTSEAIVSGLAPGQLRRDLDGREVDLRQRRDGRAADSPACPHSSTATASSEVATGRRMKGAEMFIGGSGGRSRRLPAHACRCRRRSPAWRCRRSRRRAWPRAPRRRWPPRGARRLAVGGDVSAAVGAACRRPTSRRPRRAPASAAGAGALAAAARGRASRGRGSAVAARDRHLGAVGQPREAGRHHRGRAARARLMTLSVSVCRPTVDLAHRTVSSSPTHIDEGAVRAALHRRGRHHDHMRQRVDEEPHVDELARPELQVRRWGSCAFSFTVPVVWSTWLSTTCTLPVSSTVRVVALERLDPQRRPCAMRGIDLPAGAAAAG